MARKNRRKHHEDIDIQDSITNPLSMITPSVMGTPLGMLPITPIPSLDIEEYNKDPDKNDNEDRLP
jgi:hypothetical protein